VRNYLDNEKKLIDILEEGLDWEESEGRMKSKAEMAALFLDVMGLYGNRAEFSAQLQCKTTGIQ
jgi:hypothetical protein